MTAAPTFISSDLLALPAHLPACLTRPEAVPQALLERAARYGQIEPILAGAGQERESLVVLSGIFQFLALKEAGCPQICCRLLPKESGAQEVLPLRILHDREMLENSLLWRAFLVQEIRQAGLSQEEETPLFRLMGLKGNHQEINELLALLQCDAAQQQALNEGVLLIKTLPLIRRLPKGEQAPFIELLKKYRLGCSKQQKLAELLVGLCLREQTGIVPLLAEWRASSPPQDNLPQEGQHLLSWLSVRTNPLLAEAETCFQKRVSQLRPPAFVSFHHTQSFEDEAVSVQIHYHSLERLERAWPALNEALGGEAASKQH